MREQELRKKLREHTAEGMENLKGLIAESLECEESELDFLFENSTKKGDPAYLLNQAHALLAQTFAQAGESFRELNADTQDAYLSAVSDLIAEAESLL